MKSAHYCTNPACQLCRQEDAVDLLLRDLEVVGGLRPHPAAAIDREDIASGNVWPEDED